MSSSSCLASVVGWTLVAIPLIALACGSGHEDIGSVAATVGPPPKDPNFLLAGPAQPTLGHFTIEDPGAPELGPCITGSSTKALCYTLTSELDNPELRTMMRCHGSGSRFSEENVGSLSRWSWTTNKTPA